MKLIDKNGRLFGKISVIDVVVVLLVVILAVALRHKAQLPQTSTGTVDPQITFTLWVRMTLSGAPVGLWVRSRTSR